jgi:hypothetical protein
MAAGFPARPRAAQICGANQTGLKPLRHKASRGPVHA